MLRGLLKYVYSTYSLTVVKLKGAGKRLDTHFLMFRNMDFGRLSFYEGFGIRDSL